MPECYRCGKRLKDEETIYYLGTAYCKEHAPRPITIKFIAGCIIFLIITTITVAYVIFKITGLM